MAVSEAAHFIARPVAREVVAAVLTHGNRVCMLRRSQHVHTDAGFWHCVTGYLPRRADPIAHMLVEIEEELGMRARDLFLRGRQLLDLSDDRGGGWRVHAFHFECCRDCVTLNWEHDSVLWLAPERISKLRTVSWLSSIVNGLSQTLPNVSAMRLALEG